MYSPRPWQMPNVSPRTTNSEAGLACHKDAEPSLFGLAKIAKKMDFFDQRWEVKNQESRSWGTK